MNVKDKVIAVTGGAGAIGATQTKLLAENGAEVWVLDLAAGPVTFAKSVR
ncbi:hypothetical protein SDC9_88466 [bioreactor metagenome]|uniref:Uncharacterized protein n=1 Tax=bioreactor metagenome TaxID=1076179 RepID=A0A644ZM59_9ZZZZ|nr:hypothetical protein [Oscillibacter sp.]MEA4994122.1 hypothetical protein [Oscillibacter sp.]